MTAPGRAGARAAVATDAAPPAIGPYSQAVAHGDVLYCSGALPLELDGSLRAGTAAEQTTRCLQNLAALCEAAGAPLAGALRLTVYTTVLDEFADINTAYARFFGQAPPARVTIGVAALPKGALVEIDAIVALG
ncbi:RidA family protein [Conexibacter sp. CPCC 206217]|uniref:RidA family protein n=1 Tax=Conexibacter sp. CPCC 206217 TaxID=3064574 RepID=UPI002724CA52|nr:Rid family detoxifying hydrolase [Conexibacter sp. CPCC 206217]MDO8213561.1 Rid family detoxifying hydrolase [Conexibacter sp. CPCC 206217]